MLDMVQLEKGNASDTSIAPHASPVMAGMALLQPLLSISWIAQAAGAVSHTNGEGRVWRTHTHL